MTPTEQPLQPSTEHELTQLQAQYPMPPGWSMQETFVQELDFAPLRLHMVGLVASRAASGEGDQNALGSAAGLDAAPVSRAYYELLERISILEARASQQPLCVRDLAGHVRERRSATRVFPPDPAPERQRLALSNGVALHASWAQACEAALHELVERDRVLRSFAGELVPARLDVAPGVLAKAAADRYDAAAYELGVSQPSPKHRTAALVLLPRSPELPVLYGFGTAYTLTAALQRAENETLQRLAFLWGEDLPTAAVEPAPTPEYHHDFYLYPPNQTHLRAWLQGQRSSRHAWRSLPLFDGDRTRFIDLTPASFAGKLAVAKAVSPSARRLRFGQPAYPKHAVPHPMV